jgi:hypothetical protein
MTFIFPAAMIIPRIARLELLTFIRNIIGRVNNWIRHLNLGIWRIMRICHLNFWI